MYQLYYQTEEKGKVVLFIRLSLEYARLLAKELMNKHNQYIWIEKTN